MREVPLILKRKLSMKTKSSLTILHKNHLNLSAITRALFQYFERPFGFATLTP